MSVVRNFLSHEKVEHAILWCYILSVALSPLGPVMHYSLWGICFLFLCFNVIVNGAKLRIEELSGEGKLIFLLIAALAFWTTIVSLFSISGVAHYGRNVTPIIEVLFGSYLAMRTLRDQGARTLFIKIFVAASVLIIVGNLFRLTHVIPFFPNRALKNGNAFGSLGLLVFPPVVCYAFWSLKNSYWKKLIIVLPIVGGIVLSFSSGAWLSAFLGGLVFLYYAVRYEKLTFRFFIIALGVFVACAGCIDLATQGKMRQKLVAEFKQVQAIDDLDKFTTLRNQVWSATWYMVKRRPLLGSGGKLFFNEYRKIARRKRLAKRLGLTVKRDVDHPHSTYMYLLYLGGVPALFLYIELMLLCLYRMIKLSKFEKNDIYPWAVSILVLLIEILTYGTNGDILQGRRDISVMVWCFLGLAAVLPERKSKEFNLHEDVKE